MGRGGGCAEKKAGETEPGLQWREQHSGRPREHGGKGMARRIDDDDATTTTDAGHLPNAVLEVYTFTRNRPRG
eukprot:1826741-Pyramimonas_sp.AAC.1